MCRHLAYAGPPASLRSLLIDPPYSLYRQAWAPRLQRHGTVNADGFGVGWYADGDPVPARYRRGVPMWGDPSLPDITRVTRSGAVLAAVRSATAGTAVGEQATAPFGHGRWLFSHNGLLDGWPGSAAAIADRASEAGRRDNGPSMSGALPQPSGTAALLSLEAMVDSAFLWALVLERLQAGSAMGAALAGTIAAVEAASGSGRFNFLLTDGYTIAATACGDTLWYRLAGLAPAVARASASVTVASEPSDDEPGWTEVPDRHLLIATARGVSVRPLAAGGRTASAGEAAADGLPALERVPTTDTDVSTEGIVTR